MACTMACAVPQAQGDLLDALLASCQKPALNPPLPSWGRSLSPYFAEEKYSTNTIKGQEILPNKKTSPKKVKNAAKPKTLPPAVVRAALASAKSTSIKAPKMPEKKLAVAPAPTHTPTEGIKASIDDLFPWAGPGFCVAPPPEQLPAPTTFLLG